MNNSIKLITTIQQVVDKVAPLMRKQGKRSLCEKTKDCRYRGDDGAKCFVGHLISDEYYSLGLEGNSSDYDNVRDALMFSGISEKVLDETVIGRMYGYPLVSMINKMQRDLHDDIEEEVWGNFVDGFNEKLKRFCEEHDLIYPPEEV